MVIFFIAELALTVAFKLSAWCLGKTYDGIAYLVSSKPTSNACNDNDDVNDTEFVVISRADYRSLMHHASSSSSSSLSSSLSPSLSPSSSK